MNSMGLDSNSGFSFDIYIFYLVTKFVKFVWLLMVDIFTLDLVIV